MRKITNWGMQNLRRMAHWIDGLFGQAIIVALAVIFAVTAGANA